MTATRRKGKSLGSVAKGLSKNNLYKFHVDGKMV
jgi:hypothetical protein